MYVSSSSFMYLRIAFYCDACLNSSALLVGVTTLLNTIQYSYDDVEMNILYKTKHDMRIQKVTSFIEKAWHDYLRRETFDKQVM